MIANKFALLEDWVQFIATDADGYEYGYEERPILGITQWEQPNTKTRVSLIKEGRKHFDGWRDSLIEREN